MDCYDPETGQVYRERIFRPQLGEVREWEHYVPKDIRELRHFHQNGADSMTNMLMRKIACHTRSLEPQNLAAVPTLIIDKLWTAIRRENKETLQTWKTFVNAGHGAPGVVYAAATHKIYKPVVDFFLDMASPNHAWLVDLDIGDLDCTASDLKSLAVLCNLQNLTVRCGSSPSRVQAFDDKIVANLASHAVTAGALSRLQMLFLEGARGITSAVFESLGSFPSLDTFCAYKTSVKPTHGPGAESFGWVRDPSPEFLKRSKLRTKYQSGFLTYVSFSFFELAQFRIQVQRSQDGCKVPVLDCRFGDPRLRKNGGKEVTDLDNILCFERDPKAAPRHKIRGIEKNASGPVAKKRKLNKRNLIDLDQILEGL